MMKFCLNFIIKLFFWGRRGGLLVSVLDSGSSGPGSSSDQGHCFVFLGKTFNSPVPLSTQEYKWVPGQNAGGNLRWT